MESNNGENAGAAGGFVDLLYVLPEGWIADAVSMTSPLDACRFSLVSSTCRTVADSDAVWGRFLPSDYQDIIARSVDDSRRPTSSLSFASKKQFYLHLSDHPLIIDGGTKSFSLEKRSGKKCYMLAARDLSIVWDDTPRYWRWTSLPESRFAEVAELVSVCWLEIHGKIDTCMLSPNTVYAAYFVFKVTTSSYGFELKAVEVSMGIGGVDKSKTQRVYLDGNGGGGHRRRNQVGRRQIGLFRRRRAPQVSVAAENEGQYLNQRGDGWLEIELGEYVNTRGEDGEVVMSLMEVKGGHWKSGLIVQGIEIRPKAKAMGVGGGN